MKKTHLLLIVALLVGLAGGITIGVSHTRNQFYATTQNELRIVNDSITALEHSTDPALNKMDCSYWNFKNQYFKGKKDYLDHLLGTL